MSYDIDEKVNSYCKLYLAEDMDRMGYMFERCNEIINKLFGVDVDEIKFMTVYMSSLNRELMEMGNPRLCSQSYVTSFRLYVERELFGNLEPFRRTEKYYFEDSQLYWIGYMYAYIHYHQDIKSKDLVKILPIEDMLDFYTTGHQLSEYGFYKRVKWKFEK